MEPPKLLKRLQQGQHANVTYEDFVRLLEAFGFRFLRGRGSHSVFAHPGVPDTLNIQPKRGEAKPYQIRQFLRLIRRYNLEIG
jgi:predicted RNA binding protein YcfA (HicA-like mRNA interferase family)